MWSLDGDFQTLSYHIFYYSICWLQYVHGNLWPVTFTIAWLVLLLVAISPPFFCILFSGKDSTEFFEFVYFSNFYIRIQDNLKDSIILYICLWGVVKISIPITSFFSDRLGNEHSWACVFNILNFKSNLYFLSLAYLKRIFSYLANLFLLFTNYLPSTEWFFKQKKAEKLSNPCCSILRCEIMKTLSIFSF